MAEQKVTDILLCTCDRLDLLKQAVQYLRVRTHTPYRLHVIDDASKEKNVTYLLGAGVTTSLTRRKARQGIAANWNLLAHLTESDPVVFTDDDILCPLIDPDWLAQGLAAMEADPYLGLLSLNDPACVTRRDSTGDLRHIIKRGPVVTLCRNLGGEYLFVRRKLAEQIRVPDGAPSVIKAVCLEAARRGWKVGFLTNVYCRHIGRVSVRTGKAPASEPRAQDPITLAPLEGA